jgi:hypothetical protein
MMNTGKNNAGKWNTGNENSGNENSGCWNTGNENSGYWNSGDRNSGDRNSGKWNTGDRNSGCWNTGDRNTGCWNTGNWNRCDKETGCFNTEESDTIRIFNKPCKSEDWDNADKPDLLYFNLTEWIPYYEMTDQEKLDHPTFHTTGGYLKKLDYQEAFQNAWNNASEEDRKLVEQLPNFDADVFYYISGIDVRKKSDCEGKVI